MKATRIMLMSAVALVVVGAIGVSLILNSGVQSWAAQRILVTHPDWGISVSRIQARPGRLQLTQLEIDRPGFHFLVPSATIELPLLKAIQGTLDIGSLEASGWTLDLTKSAGDAGGNAAEVLIPRVLEELQLPVDLTLGKVELDGEVVLPSVTGQPPTRAQMSLAGGGLQAGGKADFRISAQASLPQDQVVDSLNLAGTLTVMMPTPRTFSSMDLHATARAQGAGLPQGAQLTTDLTASRANSGETYSLTLERDGRSLIQVRAGLPVAPKALLSGSWSVDLRDADVSPFTLGRPLPSFDAKGSGNFSLDPSAGSGLALGGDLSLSADHLEVIRSELAPWGAVAVSANFEVQNTGAGWLVKSLSGNLSGTGPILSLNALQSFEFNPSGKVLRIENGNSDLLAVNVSGLPLTWVEPYLPDGIRLRGGALKGQLTLAAREGGMALRSTAPITIGSLTVLQGTQDLAGPVDVSLQLSGDYSSEGWTAEVSDFTARSGGTVRFSLDGKIGRLSGSDEALLANGNWTADLPALFSQPVLKDVATINSGRAEGSFTASWSKRREIAAHVELSDLAAGPSLSDSDRIGMTADLRADLEPDGQIAVQLPVQAVRGGRTSDLRLDGTVTPGSDGAGVDLRASSSVLILDDLRLLGGLMGSAGAEPSSDGPFWSGISGTVALDLKRVVSGQDVEFENVTGSVRIEDGALRFENGRAEVQNEGGVNGAGWISYEPRSPDHYLLQAEIGATNVASSLLLRTLDPVRKPVIEGPFDVSGHLEATGQMPSELFSSWTGEVKLSSSNGSFRLLRVDVADRLKTPPSRLSGMVGGFLGSVTGQDRLADWANRAQFVTEAAKALGDIQFDQLLIDATRAYDGSIRISECSLISREARLSGSGMLRPSGDDVSLARMGLDLQLQLSAQGTLGDQLRRSGLIAGTADRLGYVPLTSPFHIGGTLSEPDTSDLANILVGAASGSLINNLLGR